jgi:ferredoxin-NADP reductase
MTAKLIKARFSGSVKRTATVQSFRFAPEEKIDFIPGQFLQVMLDAANAGNNELNKYLSFSCAPGKDYIEVTKRISESEFSKKLSGLNVNDGVSIKAPMGTCVFEEGQKKISFLIGGIGITPVISIIEYIVTKKLDTDVSLLYSNRNEEEIAFKKELDDWAALNKNIKIKYLVTECQPKDTSCAFGRIDKNIVSKELDDYSERTIFIFGPPRMVEAMQAMCLEIGCKKENLRVENFIGY